MYLSLSQKGIDLVEDPSKNLSKSPHNFAPRIVSLLYYGGDMDGRELFARVMAQGGSQDRVLLLQIVKKLIRIDIIVQSHELEDPPYQFQPQGAEEISRNVKDLEDPMGEGLPEKHYPVDWYAISHRN